MNYFFHSLKKKIGNCFRYLLRPEIDINHRLVNIILACTIGLLPVNIIISIAVDTSIWGILFMFAVLAVMIFLIWLVNVRPDDQFPLLMICILVNCVIMPVLYFQSGGRACGMICWLIFGAVLGYLIMRGKLFFGYVVINILSFSTTLILEQLHPELVSKLDSGWQETTDTIFSFILVSISICAVYKYQAFLYTKQNQELSQQDDMLREMNEKLESASQAKTNFLANMSHEIRTPINAILGMDEMILRDSQDQQILGYASDIDSAGRQLLSLVNDILDISKIEAGKMEIIPVKYEMFSILNDSYNLIISRAKQKNLSVVVDNQTDLPSELFGDEIRVRQVILNLLTNAVKYTEKGTVTLSVGYEKKSEKDIVMKISVKDTGKGISLEDQKKLFENFTRVDELHNRNIEGTGLGLSITRHLVSLMNGSIEVKSTLGEGSEFTVFIPQTVISWTPMGEFTLGQEHKVVVQSGKESFTAETATVLAVDDVRVNLNVVRLLLRDTKVQIDLAESGKDALNYMSQKHYDLVLMDHMMPEMDGIQALHHIRNDNGIINPQVPVIALTANAISGVDRMYMDEGFDGYLSKPVRAAELEAALLKFLPANVVTKSKK